MQSDHHSSEPAPRASHPGHAGSFAIASWRLALLVLCGSSLFAVCLWRVFSLPGDALTQVLAGLSLTVLAGFFPIRVKASSRPFVADHVVVFLLLLTHGPEAAVVAATVSSVVRVALGRSNATKAGASAWVSPSATAVSMGMVGLILHQVLGIVQQQNWDNAGWVVLVTMLTALGHLALKRWMVRQVIDHRADLRSHLQLRSQELAWTSLKCVGSACAASLLHLGHVASGLGALATGLVVLLMTMVAMSAYFSQQQIAAEAQQAKIDAALREADTAAKHMRQMAESERRFQSAFTHASIGMALVNMDGCVLQANPALEQLLGCQPGALTGHSFTQHVKPEDRTRLAEQWLHAQRHTIEAFSIELTATKADGNPVHVSLHGSHFSDVKSSEPCLILQVQDITARHQAQQQLQHIAFHDGLTGLPNRRRFNQLLSEWAEQSVAAVREPFALMFIDCDRFKLINDSMGHTAGDEYLVTVGQRLKEQLRADDIVARVGGDEFAVLVRDVQSDDKVRQLGTRILEALRQPVPLGGVTVTSSVSMGIALSRPDHSAPEDLLRDADLAMYAAKAQGKDRLVFFDAAMLAQNAQRLRLERELRRAIAEGEISVVYQPLFQLRESKLTGFEALCRWNHPELGRIGPSTFIPIAEEMGAITAITDIVMRQATRNLKRWQSMHPTLAGLCMHVNLSSRDIAEDGLLARVSEALRQAALEPQHLVLEITENTLMENIEGGMDQLLKLRRLGVELSIDDFGTGYSSLSSLSKLPINNLKIDASFVRDLKPGTKHAEIVRAVVSLGATLGKSVIAEGIETESQLGMLDQLGCQGGQGYQLAKPMPEEDIVRLLNELVLQQLARERPLEPASHSPQVVAVKRDTRRAFESTKY